MPQLYSVNDGLQDILARRKAEALQTQQLQRQVLLDELARKDTESQISARNENAASQKEYREAMAEDRRTTAEGRQLGTLTSGQFDIGADVSKIDPDIKKLGRSRGYIADLNPDAYKGNEEAFIAGDYYTGDKEQRDEREIDENVKSLIASGVFNNPKLTETEKMAMYFQATKQKPSSAQIAGIFSKSGEPEMQDVLVEGLDGLVRDSSGKIVTKIPVGAKITSASRTPSDPRPRYQFGDMPDPKDPTKRIPARYNLDDVNAAPEPFAGGFNRTSPTNSGMRVGAPVVDESVGLAYATALSTAKSLARTPNNPKFIAANERARILQQQLISGANVPDDMKEFMQQIVNRKDQTPTAEILNRLQASGTDAIELARFAIFLRYVRGEVTAPVEAPK